MTVAKNQSVRILYLLSLFRVNHGANSAGNPSQLPRCRFHATLEGFEWFIYNRTAAFDYIVSQMEAKTPVPERRTQSLGVDGAASQLRQMFTKSSPPSESACGLFTTSMMPQKINLHPIS